MINRGTIGLNVWISCSLAWLLVAGVLGQAHAANVTGTVTAATGYVAAAKLAMPGSAALPSLEQLEIIKQRVKRGPMPGPQIPEVGLPVGPVPGTETGGSSAHANSPQYTPNQFLSYVYNLTSAIPSGFTSVVTESSTASVGAKRFFTGNWWAAYDNSGPGGTWTGISPFTQFPSIDGGFCCDQDAIYDPGHDLILWELQYINTSTSGGFRIAVFPHTYNNISTSGWYSYTFEPTSVGGGGNEWFDYVKVSLSTNYLYITANVYSTTTNRWMRTVLMRLPLDPISTGAAIPISYLSWTQNFNFTAAQGNKDVFWWASHNSNTSIRIFHWPENTGTVSWNDITVPAWSTGAQSCPVSDGTDWCAFSDYRILTGSRVKIGVYTASSGTQPSPLNYELWFFWNVGSGNGFAKDYIEAVRIGIDETFASAPVNKGRPFIWSSTIPFAYVGSSPNIRGDIGISFFAGQGPGGAPCGVISVADDYGSLPPGWNNPYSLIAGDCSSKGPVANRWGDYVTVRPEYPTPFWWGGSWSLQGGGNNSNSVPVAVRFGRYRDWGGEQRFTFSKY